jgi:hypothetical protein
LRSDRVAEQWAGAEVVARDRYGLSGAWRTHRRQEASHRLRSGTQEMDVEDPDNASYWASIMALMQQRISAEHDAESADRATLASGRSTGGIGGAGAAELGPVAEMVEAALGGTLEELSELELEVDSEVANPACPDPAFWQAIRPRCVSCPHLSAKVVCAAHSRAAWQLCIHRPQDFHVNASTWPVARQHKNRSQTHTVTLLAELRSAKQSAS